MHLATQAAMDEGDISHPMLESAGRVASAAVALAWVVVLVRLLGHRIFLTHDTMISYAHVWFIAGRLWHGHTIPLHMPTVDHGQGLAYPYGFLPWTAAALVRPLLGDRAVTLALVTGVVGAVVATFWAFPELRRGWWAAAVLLNPALVTSPLLGQIPFLWGGALLLVAIGAWRRERTAVAVVAAGLAQATHPAVVGPLALALVLAFLPWERRRPALVRAYFLSLVVAAPGVWMVFESPVLNDTSTATKVVELIDTLAPRSLLFVVPIALVVLQRSRRLWVAPVASGVLIVSTVVMWAPMGMTVAWRGLRLQPDTQMVAFAAGNPAFAPGATYRVLRLGDGKVSMYQLLQHGGRLDSEFFPESIDRRSWPTAGAYADFLRQRHVDYVMLWRGYDHAGTNEHELLDGLAADTGCRSGVGVTLVTHVRSYDVYRIDPRCPSGAAATG